MSDPHVVTALIAKRAELSAQIDDYYAVGRRMLAALKAIDAVLVLLKPDIKLYAIKPHRVRRNARRGDFARIVLGYLRTAAHPCSAEELAAHAIAERGLNADESLVKKTAKRVRENLRYYQKKGLVRSTKGSGGRLVWEVDG